jgi:Flp pilus assembly protein TadG
MRRVVQRKKREQGTSILEFALVAIPTVFMMLGVVVVGIDLGRSVQVAQICRDADSMFVRGVPLYQSAAQGIIVRLGQNLNLQTSGGDGLVILSKIQSVPNTAVCGAVGTSSYVNCAAGNYINVLVQRIIFGDTTLPGTHYPTAGSVTYDSLDQVNNYLTDPNAVVSSFSSTLALKQNETSYVAETYFRSPTVNLGAFQGAPGTYAQAFF